MYISILLYLKSWMKIITVCAATVYSDIMFERLDRPRQDMKHFESSQLAEVLCPWLPGPCLSPSAKGVHRCLRGFIGSHQLAHPLGESEATVAWLQALGRWKRWENLEKRDCLCHKFGENHANWTIRSSEFSDGRSSPRWSFSDLTPLPHCRPNWFQTAVLMSGSLAIPSLQQCGTVCRLLCQRPVVIGPLQSPHHPCVTLFAGNWIILES